MSDAPAGTVTVAVALGEAGSAGACEHLGGAPRLGPCVRARRPPDLQGDLRCPEWRLCRVVGVEDLVGEEVLPGVARVGLVDGCVVLPVPNSPLTATSVPATRTLPCCGAVVSRPRVGLPVSFSSTSTVLATSTRVL